MNAWRARSLADVELDDLFADCSFFRMHPGAPAEPVLVAWGITSAGKPVFLGLEPGNSESTDAWAGFFRGLTARGGVPQRRLRPPRLLPPLPGRALVADPALHFIERTFGETRRGVKAIGRFPGERSCLSLVWAVLDRASRGWRGVQQTIPSIRLLAELRRELFATGPIVDEAAVEEAVVPAA